MVLLFTSTVMAISFLSPIVLAASFDFSSPNSVSIKNEFVVSISSDLTKTYDVKIFVEDLNSSPRTISETFNPDTQEWQNSYYYIKQIFPIEKNFKVRILKSGNWEICVRLRESTTETKCKNISVIESDDKPKEESSQSETESIEDNSSELNQESPDLEEENSQKKDESSIEKTIIPIPNNTEIKNKELTLSQKTNNSPINLNPIETKESTEIITKQEKIRLGVIISFTLLTIFLIVLLALKKL